MKCMRAHLPIHQHAPGLAESFGTLKKNKLLKRMKMLGPKTFVRKRFENSRKCSENAPNMRRKCEKKFQKVFYVETVENFSFKTSSGPER